MSVSRSTDRTSNPFASLQSLWQQASSATGAQAQSDPLSALLGGARPAKRRRRLFDQRGSLDRRGSLAQRHDSRVGQCLVAIRPADLQALLALQTNGANQQSLASQFDNDAASGTDPLSELADVSRAKARSHHHHHHDAAARPAPSGSANHDRHCIERLTIRPRPAHRRAAPAAPTAATISSSNCCRCRRNWSRPRPRRASLPLSGSAKLAVRLDLAA